MSMLSHPWLVGGGLALLVLAFLLRRWAARHDLKDLAIDAAWQVAKARGNIAAASDSEIGRRLQELSADSSNIGRATKVAGHAARHVMAKVVNLVALAATVIGVALLAAAYFWR